VSPNFGLWALIWPVQPSHWTHTDLSVYKKAKIIATKAPVLSVYSAPICCVIADAVLADAEMVGEP